MRTIRPLVQADVDALRAEPQVWVLWLGASLPVRIWNRVVQDPCGCWRVTGWNSGNGFANMRVRGKTHKVHRVVWTLLKGFISDKHVLDHVKAKGCKYRDCCNPEHLEPVEDKENTNRGNAVLYSTLTNP
jgi:hypothetical protein